MKHIKLLSISSIIITLSGLIILFKNIKIGNWLANSMKNNSYSQRIAYATFPENLQFLGKSLLVAGLTIALFTLFLFVIIENFKKDNN